MGFVVGCESRVKAVRAGLRGVGVGGTRRGRKSGVGECGSERDRRRTEAESTQEAFSRSREVGIESLPGKPGTIETP
jgi:hypothetical protein